MTDPEKIFGRLGNKLFQYATLYSLARENNTDFYFQDPKWFEKYAEEFRTIFRPEGEVIDQVAIHVRRGGNPINPDEPKYSDNPFYVDLSKTGYYEEAMALFPNDNFLIFSDDIPWCKANLPRADYSVGHTALEDLELMACCRGHIIANSSFSYMGAYLSPFSKKIVAPSKDRWYTDGIERTRCPSNWVRL